MIIGQFGRPYKRHFGAVSASGFGDLLVLGGNDHSVHLPGRQGVADGMGDKGAARQRLQVLARHAL
jgi:hypothetical protein